MLIHVYLASVKLK